MKLRRTVILIAGYLLLCSNYHIVSAEQQDMQAVVIDNFNIGSIDKNELDDYYKKHGFLSEYISCLAAVRDDASICNKLGSEESQFCIRRFYQLHGFYNELIITGMLTTKAMFACKRYKGMTTQQCESWARAFITQDTTICKKEAKNKEEENECMAMLTQNPTVCGDNKCRDTVFYIKAIKDGDIKICEMIKNEAIKALCKGDVTMDENTCKQSKDFKEFIKVYYPKMQSGRQR